MPEGGRESLAKAIEPQTLSARPAYKLPPLELSQSVPLSEKAENTPGVRRQHHTYIGRNYIGRDYAGHHYVGHTYVRP